MSASTSKRWTSASGTELPGRSPLPVPAAALSPGRHSSRRSVSLSDTAPPASGGGAASIARTLWPSSSSGGSKSGKNKAPPRAPSPLSSASSSSSSAATLADHLAKDDTPQSLSRQRSCTELPRFADADAEARKIGKPSGKGGGGHAFGRSMRLLPSTKPAGVTLTPGRVAPSDLRRLANGGVSLDAAADVASSGSECSDASRGSATTRTVSKPHSPLLPRTNSVRLLGSSNTQWALSPGRRSGSPLKAKTTLPTVPEAAKGKKSLISLGWGHIFHRRKHAAEDASIAAATVTLLSSPPVSSSRSSTGGGAEVWHEMRMAHCRLLQWRFANAKAEAARKRKQASAELDLMGTWASVSELRGKVARKRVQLEKEKQKIRLNTVLSSQMKDLESWEQVETKHVAALASTVDCTRAAVCRLPLTNGAKVSVPSLATILQQGPAVLRRPTRSTSTSTTSYPATPTSAVSSSSREADRRFEKTGRHGYDLHLFSSRTGSWSTKATRDMGWFPCDGHAKVFSVGGGSLAWVDLRHGVLLCDVLGEEERPVMHRIRLPPLLPSNKADFGPGFDDAEPPLDQIRDVTCRDGWFRLVETEFPDLDDNDLTQLRWTATMFRTRISSENWELCHTVDSADLSLADACVSDDLIPEMWDDRLARTSSLGACPSNIFFCETIGIVKFPIKERKKEEF
ncbi:hypothetical protein BAE44_0018191 [Dichanthelium oligosanthes]|uniref:DUF1618 domain-containing protein n=1 Tax=Dichanthelium oligosanthes TaxID=888268 RepID=A0A1E5V6J9_9POAL|nr:hypothetical protein BAE44_0018191 [Dichanthelium oligosanthes]